MPLPEGEQQKGQGSEAAARGALRKGPGAMVQGEAGGAGGEICKEGEGVSQA